MGRQTGTPCNTLAPHLWSCFGWCHGWGLKIGYQSHTMGRMAREGQYFNHIYIYFMAWDFRSMRLALRRFCCRRLRPQCPCFSSSSQSCRSASRRIRACAFRRSRTSLSHGSPVASWRRLPYSRRPTAVRRRGCSTRGAPTLTTPSSTSSVSATRGLHSRFLSGSSSVRASWRSYGHLSTSSISSPRCLSTSTSCSPITKRSARSNASLITFGELE